jgi:glycosyltransferase involved in cell wall biosynthesis
MPKILISANTDWFLYNYRRALAKFLTEVGYEVVLVSPPGIYVSQLEVKGFRWIKWTLSRQGMVPWEDLDSILSLVRIYRRESPDIVHHHTIKPVLYGSLAARLAGVPRIVNSITGRGYVFISQDISARVIRWIVSPLLKFALQYPNNLIIFENQADRQSFIDQGFATEAQSTVIEGVGVDPEEFHPTPEEPGVPLVLMSGRLLWDKGVGVLVEAARMVKDRLDVRVVLAGIPDPGNPGSIDEGILGSWQQEGVIEWWGWQADMPSVYQKCHVVVLPTRYGEGVPTSLIEGAACGRPLVASDIPGCLPIVKPEINGLLVPADDPAALAQALERLISNPQLRQKMGQAGRELFLREFTHAQVNQNTLEVYNRLFENGWAS